MAVSQRDGLDVQVYPISVSGYQLEDIPFGQEVLHSIETLILAIPDPYTLLDGDA